MNLGTDNALIEIARLYYRTGLSQQDIADRCGISRPSVSLALKRCRERGLVEIHIREPSSRVLELGGELATRFGLERVIVVETGGDPGDLLPKLGKAGAKYLTSIFSDNMRIGLSWGTTLFHTVDQLRARDLKGVEVVQMIGALGSDNPRYDGVELARLLAERLHGSYSMIQAPALVRSRELKHLLLKEPRIRESLCKAAAADLALVGISSDRPAHSALVRAGYMTDAEARAICEAGAVGHVCGHHIDRDGRAVASPLNQTIMGIDVEQLQAIPRVVGLAGGKEKVEAILATLRAGLLRVLITDESAARAMVDHAAAIEPEGEA